MKQVFSLFLLTLALTAQLSPARADAPIGQKETTKAILDKYQKTRAARDVSKELCEQVMGNPRAKALMCEMLSKDPEARQWLKLKN